MLSELLGKIHQGDCLEFMKQLPDKCVDLVLTDPPYGIGADEAQMEAAMQRIKANGESKAGRGWKYYGETQWDRERPNKIVFDEINRIAKKSVIWGGNYFADLLPPSMGWIAWDKGQRDFSLADFEMAWTSEWKAARCIVYPRAKALQDGRHHPTQKPLYLMRWCLENYSSENDLIFDPFMGSGTTAIASYQLGRKWFGCEISKEYCDIANKRIENEMNNLFEVNNA